MPFGLDVNRMEVPCPIGCRIAERKKRERWGTGLLQRLAKDLKNESSDHPIGGHFVDVNKMVDLGSGRLRQVDDLMLTRYACYPFPKVGPWSWIPLINIWISRNIA
jgi:hypothetical protein